MPALIGVHLAHRHLGTGSFQLSLRLHLVAYFVLNQFQISDFHELIFEDSRYLDGVIVHDNYWLLELSLQP